MQLPVLSVLCLHLIAVGIAALVRLYGQKIINFGEGRPAIEIVRVDNGERAVHRTLAAGQRVTGSPRLRAAFGERNPFRQAVKLLIDVGHMEEFFHAVADARTEFSFHLALDDEHHIAETGASCVKQGKINDDVPLRIDRLDLLEPPEAAAHAFGHNHE